MFCLADTKGWLSTYESNHHISSNVIEVIRAVLNSLLFIFFFYKKILHAPKAPKVQKHKDTTKQKHKMLQVNKNKKMCLKISKGEKVSCLLICVFVLFVHVKKRTLEKREKSPQSDVINTDVPTTRLMY